MERLPRFALLGTLAVFAALSLCYSFATPLKRGPDEPAHFIYVRSMATDFAPPPIAHVETHSENSTSSHEGHQPPLYYTLLAIPFAILKALGASNQAIWRVLRIMSVVIGVGWIYAVYLFAKEFFQREDFGVAAAAFTALLPTSAYMAGVIGNDCLVSLLFTLALIPMLSYLRSGKLSAKGAALAGVASGLAILTKAQGLVLLPAFAVASLLVWRRGGYAQWREMLHNLTIVFGAALLLDGWWFLRCWVLYGAVMPHSLYHPLLPGGMMMLAGDPLSGLALVREITAMAYGHFWIPFWLVRTRLSWGFCLNIEYALGALALTGLFLRLRKKDLDRRLLAFLAFVVGILYAAYIRYALVVDRGAIEQGRLFLPVAGIAGIVFSAGCAEWLPRPWAKKAGVVAAVIIMILINLAIAWCGHTYYAAGGP